MIVVFGTVCIDRLRRVPSLPPVGGYVEATSETLLLGGEAANTANALRVWRAPFTLATHPLGDDADGPVLRGLVRGLGLHPIELAAPRRSHLRADPGEMDGCETPVCDIYITPDGERTMFGKGFTNSERFVSLDALPLSEGDWFTAEPNMPNMAREAVRRAHDAGMKIWTMDFTRPDEEIPAGSIWQSGTDWAGVKGDAQANLSWAAGHSDRHRCTTIVTDGGDGLVLGRGGEAIHLPAFVAPSVVDTTGVGDAFRAGALRSLHRGGTLGSAIRFGAAAGALACATIGATSRVPSVSEVEAFIRSQPEIADRFNAVD